MLGQAARSQIFKEASSEYASSAAMIQSHAIWRLSKETESQHENLESLRLGEDWWLKRFTTAEQLKPAQVKAASSASGINVDTKPIDGQGYEDAFAQVEKNGGA